MKTQLILLDNPIIVSDEEIKEGDLVLALDTNTIFKCNKHEANKPIKEFKELYRKIIARIEGLPSVDWNGLEDEFGWVNVEKLAKEWYESAQYSSSLIADHGSYIQGFRKAQSLNEKKFSLEDVKDLVSQGWFNGIGYIIKSEKSFNTFDDYWNYLSNQLQQPEVFDIEVEMEEYDHDESWSEIGGAYETFKLRPKITNNSIKIMKKL